MKRLADRVAVVTGAGSGIGRATSEALARAGCHLALVDVSLPAVQETSVAKGIVRSIERDRGRLVVGPYAHLISVWSRLAPGRARLIGQLTDRL